MRSYDKEVDVLEKVSGYLIQHGRVKFNYFMLTVNCGLLDKSFYTDFPSKVQNFPKCDSFLRTRLQVYDNWSRDQQQVT